MDIIFTCISSWKHSLVARTPCSRSKMLISSPFPIFFLAAFLIFIFQMECLVMADVTDITTDQSALLALKSSITSDTEQILATNWSTAPSVCDWVGVTCGSHHHRVTALNVSNMDLTGSIPPQLGNLSFLVSLDMESNHFHGKLPEELARLRRLRYISLSYNNFTGEFPSWISLLTGLQYISLANNSFAGIIPPSIANLSNLEDVYVHFNSLEGRIPEQMGYLHSLKRLSMSGNQFTGPIPFTIFNISTLEDVALSSNRLSDNLHDDICRRAPRLKSVLVSWNNLQGQIPSGLSECLELKRLSLSFNNFTGYIPRGISNLAKLEQFFLGGNNLRGEIPREVGNLTMLTVLDIVGSNLTGSIPKEIGNLYKLEELRLGHNGLTGSLPIELFNISTLRIIALTSNNLSGTLPPSMGYKLQNLEYLLVNENNLSGDIPSSISNVSKLIGLSLRSNEFSGSVPNSIGNLQNLVLLNIATNKLSSESSAPQLSFITSLTNCRSLRYLVMYENPLNGLLPASIGNFSTSLENIYAARCKIRGSIPNEIGNLSKILLLDLSENELSGYIPRTIQGLGSLQQFSFGYNRIREPFPNVFCELHSLGVIQLSKNEFLGPIPDCLGSLTSLREVYLDTNKLTSIPASLWNMKDLIVLDLHANSIGGSLPPELGNLKAATDIVLSNNQLSDTIPTAIGDLQNLKNLFLANNKLQGSIPESIGNMLSLELLDLSHNKLSCSIPKSLEALQYLKYFNVSFNGLSGEIPPGGPFRNFTNKSFMFNEAFCGASRFKVPPCRSVPTHNSSKSKVLRLLFIVFGITALIAVIIAVLVLLRLRKKQNDPSSKDLLLPVETCGRFSYYELLQATGAYSESNLLGTGSSGSVYRAILRDGTHLAVKVFNLQVEDAFKSFDTECEVLRNLRHRNLTKVIGSCCSSTHDFKALVLEYMLNGSLEKWLYSHNHFLDLMQRLNLMIDVACALEYLHHGYTVPVVHCDLKSSNILLDEEMIGHVSDFGISKLLSEGQSAVHTRTLATLGYVAPEYGLEGLVSPRTDVYSFGIVLMETFSKRKPSDDMFSGDLTLKSWIEDSVPNATTQVIDANVLGTEDEDFAKKLECASKILELALHCCTEHPNERMNMKDVVVSMKKIRHQFVTSVEA